MYGRHRDRTPIVPGILIGLTICFLASGIGMVQLRCKGPLAGDFPCGDWPRDGFTYHFWLALLPTLGVWSLAATSWANRAHRSLLDGLAELGETASPMLGMILGWSWYGLTGDQFHLPACKTPILCHDVVRSSLVIWISPWILWAALRLGAMWRHSKAPHATE